MKIILLCALAGAAIGGALGMAEQRDSVETDAGTGYERVRLEADGRLVALGLGSDVWTDLPRDSIRVGPDGRSEILFADGGVGKALNLNDLHAGGMSIRNDAPPIAYLPARKPGEKWLLIVNTPSEVDVIYADGGVLGRCKR